MDDTIKKYVQSETDDAERAVRVYGKKLCKLMDIIKQHGDIPRAAAAADIPAALVASLEEYYGDDPIVRDASRELREAAKLGRKNRPSYAKQLFLLGLDTHGLLTEAVASQPWYRLQWFSDQRMTDHDFDAAWLDAMTTATDRLKREAWRRAHDGYQEPVAYKGQIAIDEQGNPVTITKYSDSLLLALLKRYDPAFQDSIKVNSNVQVQGGGSFAGMLSSLSADELAVLQKLTAAPGEKTEIMEDDDTSTT